MAEPAVAEQVTEFPPHHEAAQLRTLDGQPLTWADLHARREAYYARERVIVLERKRPRVTPRARACRDCGGVVGFYRRLCDGCKLLRVRPPRPLITPKTAQIVAALSERYACMALPYGAQRDLALEFGVSREYIRQISNRYGFTGRIVKQSVKGQRPLCPFCNERPARKRFDSCGPCGTVELPCAECGKPKQVSVAALTRKLTTDSEKRAARGLPQYSGRVFCNQRCTGAYAGKHYGWGSATHPTHTRSAAS